MSKTPPKRTRQFKQPKAGAPKGNLNAEVLDTPAKRQDAFRLYCIHIGAGYSATSFYEPVCDDTIDAMLVKYKDEFDMSKLRQAKNKGRLVWERIGLKGTIGEIKNFNAHSWKFNMQNRLGWKDRSEHGLDGPTRAVFKLRMGLKDLGAPKDDE